MPSVLELEILRIRNMTATEKVDVMHSLWRQAWSLKEAGVRGHHPEWSDEEVKSAVREFFRHD